MNKLLCFSALLLTIITASCKKDDPAPSGSERYKALTSGGWRTTSVLLYTTTAGSTVTTDLFTNSSPCYKDNLQIYRTDAHLIVDQGPDKCAATNPQQTQLGFWSLVANESAILVVAAPDSIYYVIKRFDADSMTTEFYDTSGSTTERYVFAYRHEI